MVDLDEIEALAEIEEYPTHTVASVMGRHPPGGSNLHYRLEAVQTPPALAAGKAESGWDFETLLGQYDPNEGEVVIWKKGIDYVADLMKVPERMIQRIVKYHEFAHGVHHLGLMGAASPHSAAASIMADVRFRAAPEEIREQIAQLATVASIRDRLAGAAHPAARKFLGAMLDTVFVMMNRQREQYRVPLATKTMDLKRLKTKLGLILNMCDSGVFPTAFHIEGIID